MKQIFLFLTSLFLFANCTSKIESSTTIELPAHNIQAVQTLKPGEHPKQINELQSFSPKGIADYLNENEGRKFF